MAETPAFRPSFRASFLRALAAALVLSLAPPLAGAAGATCLQAVFFDLGDTLVATGSGGLFFKKPGAQEVVDQLQARGVQLGIITNVPAGWTREDLEAVLAEPEFLDEFDVLVLSSEAPAPKPSPLIYSHAHSLLPTPVPIGATAFVGENLAEIANTQSNPTSGARSVGMLGIHVSSNAPSPLADFTIAPNALTNVTLIVETLCALFTDGFESGGIGSWH